MWIATNRFQINNNHADLFEKHWRRRESYLSQMPEFIRFRLLRAPADSETTEFLSYTEWLSQEGFQQWMSSDQIRKAHGQSTLPRDVYAGPPQFKGYHVLLDEVPGGRADSRSIWLDLKVEKAFAKESQEQRNIVQNAKTQGLPDIQVGAFEGQLLEILVRSAHAKVAIEVGTLGGYSASWIAKGLSSEGHLWSLEKEEHNAKVAQDSLNKAGFGEKVTIVTGDAKESLARILEKCGPVDFAFVDADKASYGMYVEALIPRLRSGGLIVCDNAYLWGAMNHFNVDAQVPEIKNENGDRSYNSEQVQGMFSCWKQLAVHPELCSLVLPTGEGLAVAVKR